LIVSPWEKGTVPIFVRIRICDKIISQMGISRKKIKQAKKLYPQKSIEEIASLLEIPRRDLAEALRQEGFKIAQAEPVPRFPAGKIRWPVLVLLGICVLLVYANSYQNVFHYDDFHSLTENIHIRKLANIPKFFSDPQTFSSKISVKMVRPVLLTTFALNYAWTEYKPWSWILVNILIHLFNVLFVYLFLVHLFGRQKFAAITALLFALHPVNTETVNYINCRSSLLVSTFMLISLYGFARSIYDKNWPWQAVSIASFGLGMLVKEEAIVVLALALVLDVLFLWPQTRGNLFNRILFHYLPFLAVIGIYFYYRHSVLEFWLQDSQPRLLLVNLLTQTRCLVHYLNLLFLPIHQNTSYENIEYTRLIQDKILLAGIYLAFWLGLAFYFWKKFPVLIFFVLVFYITLAPTTIIPLNAIMNEHRLYLPSLGLALLLAAGAESLETRLSGWKKDLVSLGLVFLFLSFSGLSANRNRTWISDMMLWRDAIKKSPAKAQVISDLGNAYFRREPADLNRAEQLYLWAIRADTGYFKAYHNLAIINFRHGDEMSLEKNSARAEQYYREAIKYFQQAIEIFPANPDSWNDMGTTHYKLKEYDQAEKCYRQALQINPLGYKTYFNLANDYLDQKRIPESEEALKAGIKIYDKDPQLWFMLSHLQALQGKYQEALESLEHARSLAPSDPTIQKFYNQLYDYIQQLKSNPQPPP